MFGVKVWWDGFTEAFFYRICGWLRFWSVFAPGLDFHAFIDKRFTLLFSLFCVLLIGGFVALKFLV